jgi:hypothetical protein
MRRNGGEGACDLDREIFAYMRGELAQK